MVMASVPEKWWETSTGTQHWRTAWRNFGHAELTAACYVDYFTAGGATRTVDGSANIIPPRREPADRLRPGDAGLDGAIEKTEHERRT